MDLKTLSAAVARFSANFCNELDQSKSAISSPLSAELLLALLALGTTDPAQKELLTSLGIPDVKSMKSSFSALSSQLKTIQGVILNVANKIYIKEGGYELLPEMKDDAVIVFDAALEKLDFTKSAAAADIINTWVKEKTNDKIQNIISPPALNSETRLVLVNAIYFKGNWEKKFDPQNTLDQIFHVNTTTEVIVPMMYKRDDFFYGESEYLGVQLLRMYYVGGEASMLIILPNEIDGLHEVLKKLADGHDLLGDINKMKSTKVEATLPKFKIETEINLNKLLPKLGIKAIFDKNNSGLTKILSAPEPLVVSEAIQKAFIEVNEEGAEAAAVTRMKIIKKKGPPPAQKFFANHPFLYILTGVENTLLFMGFYNGKI